MTQAACRDLLAEALVRLEDAGFRTVLHVHDEVVVETGSADDESRVVAICTGMPPWADGLPIAAKAFTTRYYRK